MYALTDSQRNAAGHRAPVESAISGGALSQQTPEKEQALEELRNVPAWVLLGEPGAGKSTAFAMQVQAIQEQAIHSQATNAQAKSALPMDAQSMQLQVREGTTTGAVLLTVAEFIHADPQVQENWKNKCLFLDGLDEARGGSDNAMLYQIKNKLQALNNPKFRLACRAADWYGPSDHSVLCGASPNGQLPVYALQPLTTADVETIVNQHISDREKQSTNSQQSQPPNPKSGNSPGADFLTQAKQAGLDNVLENPQLLQLLLKAHQQGQLPTNKKELYEAACKQLVAEHNKAHRDKTRGAISNPTGSANPAILEETKLQAAGYVCAMLLLGNYQGVALDDEAVTPVQQRAVDSAASTPLYCTLQQCEPPEDLWLAAQAVLRTKLFKPATTQQEHGNASHLANVGLPLQEQIQPTHRTMAEYLAARWLANQITHKKLSARRLKTLLLGFDKKPVAGLRGLYGWLLTLCPTELCNWISYDAWAVVQYGDANSLSDTHLELLLEKLRENIQTHPDMGREFVDTTYLGTLYRPTLQTQFTNWLQNTPTEEADKHWLNCVLNVLRYAQQGAHFATDLEQLVRNTRLPEWLRTSALQAWLAGRGNPATGHVQPVQQATNTNPALNLLNDIHHHKLPDPTRELMGVLLEHLFPQVLSGIEALQYLQFFDGTNFGCFVNFWYRDFLKKLPSDQLPAVLDALPHNPASQEWHRLQQLNPGSGNDSDFSSFFYDLVNQGVQTHGQNIAPTTLFDWLGLLGKYPHTISGLNNELPTLTDWFKENPAIYKNLLSVCYQQSRQANNPRQALYKNSQRLPEIAAPKDMGFWHLQQIDQEPCEALAKIHLEKQLQTYSLHSTRLNTTI
ncbi:MAG: hypothetical protein HC848_06705 [Limnobacter sp.]|nr:hypothetical protein [Limnobacter sp.]